MYDIIVCTESEWGQYTLGHVENLVWIAVAMLSQCLVNTVVLSKPLFNDVVQWGRTSTNPKVSGCQSWYSIETEVK